MNATTSPLSRSSEYEKGEAKYVAGLTATPVRKDGHHPIILMQCVRFAST